MKKLLFFSLCSFLISQLIAQTFQKKQITNFDFDSRGAVIPSYPLGLSIGNNSPIFFEAQDGNTINIMMMSYNPDTDSFFNPIPVTQSISKNINLDANGVGNYNTRKIHLIWQTNENGNWDIALQILNDTTWSPKIYIANSPLDETKPKFVVSHNYPYPAENEIDILYEKENSIYLYQQRDSIINHKIIFSGNNENIFSQATGVNNNTWYGAPQGLYIVARFRPNDSTSTIVYRYKAYNDSIWSPIYAAYDSGYCENPNFYNLYFTDCPLSFEKIIEGKKQVFILPKLLNLGQNYQAERLIDDSTISTSELKLFMYGIIGKDDIYFYGPHSFKAISQDSAYVICLHSPFPLHAKFYTRVPDTRIGLGNLGIAYGYAVSYRIWEDSANGKINLFGFLQYDAIGSVNDKIVLNNFMLYQNYPNPFNPKTIIKFELLSRDFVSLKTFDVLGNEVATLVNEEKDAGVYKLSFDGSSLASGIYFYRLSAGRNQQSRKMILLK